MTKAVFFFFLPDYHLNLPGHYDFPVSPHLEGTSVVEGVTSDQDVAEYIEQDSRGPYAEDYKRLVKSVLVCYVNQCLEGVDL